MLDVSNLSRTYGDYKAVDNVSFSIGHGEIVGLLGHNGAGKTTIMKMLSGYLEPNQGQITIDDTDIALEPKKIQQGLGYLPENLPVYQELSVADYLDYAADLKGLTDQTKHNEIKRAIDATEIGAKLMDPIATLSRGYKQRVGVAQAILGQPKLLILDEPTNGLDPTQTEHMRQLIRDIAKHATVILSTHIMQEVEALCDRVLILNRGHLAVDAKLRDLYKSNIVSLATSMPQSKTNTLLSVPGVKQLEQNTNATRGTDADGVNHFTLTLDDNTDSNAVRAAIAKTIVNNDFDLYEINTQHRDLESLFREVSNDAIGPSQINSQQGVSHAA